MIGHSIKDAEARVIVVGEGYNESFFEETQLMNQYTNVGKYDEYYVYRLDK